MSTVAVRRAGTAPPGSWRLVAGRELRDLWLGGRALSLLLVAALLFGVLTYLSASEASLNLLDAKEAVYLLVQVLLIVGALLVLVATADSISGERERRTLEPLLLAPVSRRQIALGKPLGGGSLWAGTFLVGIPYVLVLADGPGVATTALAVTALVGTLLAIALASFGTIVSALSASNRLSLAASLIAVLVLTAPSRVPGITKSSLGDAILHVNPITSGLRAAEELIVKGAAWSDVAEWLISPAVAVAAVAGVAILAALAPRLLVLDRS